MSTTITLSISTQMYIDQMSVDQMSIDQMYVDQMSIDQMYVDQMSIDQMPQHPFNTFKGCFKSEFYM